MYTLSKQDNDITYDTCEYVLDTVEDLRDLPDCRMGSTAFVISTSEIYMKNGKKEWEKI